MGLNHAQRMNVMFEYLNREIDGNIDKFALKCGISKTLVIDCLTRRKQSLNLSVRYTISKNLYFSSIIWSENFQNEQHMLARLQKDYFVNIC